MPETEIFEAGAPISRFVGMVSLNITLSWSKSLKMALSIWMLGNRLHLLISINRLIAIIFPIDSHKYITIRGIILLATLATLSALLQASPTIFGLKIISVLEQNLTDFSGWCLVLLLSKYNEMEFSIN